jgi:hypothetical protein
MTGPYLDSSELATRYYNLLGRIVTAWSRIERNVEVTLFEAGVFHNNSDLAIVSWTRKHEALTRVLRSRCDYSAKKGFFDTFLADLVRSGHKRNELVHGYLEVAKTPKTEAGTLTVVGIRFDKRRRRKMVSQFNLAGLSDLLVELQKLDASSAIIVAATLIEKSSKARPETR